MKSFFATHNRALKAEWLKLHHSGMSWFCLAVAGIIPVFHTVVSFFASIGNADPERGNKMIEADFEVFGIVFFPVFLVILMVRLVYMEYRSDTWKLIETQPVSKAAIYFAKWEIAAFISFAALVILILLAYLGGWILQFGRPSLGYQQANIHWEPVLHVLIRCWIAGLCIISVQYCISVLVKSFVLPMSIGLIAIFGGSFAQELGYMNWWPYSASQNTLDTYHGAPNGAFLLSHEKISLLTSLLFIWLGYQLYRRRSFKKAFLSPVRNLPIALAVIAVFAFAICAVDQPTILGRYTATVLAGKIESPNPVTQVLLLRSPMMDTVLVTPVKDHRFHIKTDKEIAPGIYYVKAGSQLTTVFMGTNDSVYLDIGYKDQRESVKISGTRVAENDYLENGKRMDMDILKQHAANVSPSDFADDFLEYYDDGVRMLEAFKTSDRIKPADDFIQLRKKLFAMQALALADGFYPRVHAAYFPNEELKFPESVNRVRAGITMNSPELISFPEYRRYVTSVLRERSGMNDSLYFAMLGDSISDPYTRDVMLYEAASASIAKMKDSTRRNAIVGRLLERVQTPHVKAKLIESNARANNLLNATPAYDFTAEALNGKEVKLSHLAGKYIVVEFRAASCEPCKSESVYFEKIAHRYTSPNVAFVSLALEKDKKAWQTEAGLKKEKKVLQLLGKDEAGKLSQVYGLKDMPWFILIDPNGNIINTKLPYPSEPEFEMLLQKELPSRYR